MGLPSSGTISASDINIEAARVGTTNAPLGIQTGTAGDGSLVKLYDDATPSPVDQNSPYAYSDFYGKSYTPPVISCGTSTAAIGQGSGNGYFEAQLDFSTTTGAIVIYFWPQNVPDGISFVYNSVTYNTLTSDLDGVITAATGTNNICGATGTEAALIAGSPYELTKSVWNGTSFGATGNNEANLIAAASNINLSTGLQIYTLVIPKTAASPSNGVLKIMAPTSGTAWRVTAPCPITLPSFTTNSVAASKGAACCTATQDQTYYFARNATSIPSPYTTFVIDTNTLPQVNNFVYSNSTGATALANGFYKISATQAIQVVDGTVLAVSTCATCLTPYNSSANSTLGNVCSATINQTYYHNGSGSTPVANDIVYSNQTPSFLPSGYYKISSSQYIIVGSSGVVSSVNNCASVIGPISASGRESSSQFVCFNSGTTQYWYEGTAGTLPGLGDKCYDTSTVPGTVLVAGWYRKGPDTGDGRMQIDSVGAIITDEAC